MNPMTARSFLILLCASCSLHGSHANSYLRATSSTVVTDNPTSSPTLSPTVSPTASPTSGPTSGPTESPTFGPTLSTVPTEVVSDAPSTAPDDYERVGDNLKCPYRSTDRLFRTDDNAPLTVQECKEQCLATEGCHYFSLGNSDISPSKYAGVCMGCVADSTLDDHTGFTAYQLIQETSSSP